MQEVGVAKWWMGCGRRDGGGERRQRGAVECFWPLALVCQYVGMPEMAAGWWERVVVMGTVGEKACHHLHSTTTVF